MFKAASGLLNNISFLLTLNGPIHCAITDIEFFQSNPFLGPDLSGPITHFTAKTEYLVIKHVFLPPKALQGPMFIIWCLSTLTGPMCVILSFRALTRLIFAPKCLNKQNRRFYLFRPDHLQA